MWPFKKKTNYNNDINLLSGKIKAINLLCEKGVMNIDFNSRTVRVFGNIIENKPNKFKENWIKSVTAYFSFNGFDHSDKIEFIDMETGNLLFKSINGKLIKTT